jgi:large subunit ribosomal protein L15
MDLKALHALPSVKKRPARKRVGRGPGSGLGKRSGRGQKGAGSRTGAHRRDFYEGGQTPLMRRLPKRGFTNSPFSTTRFSTVNVADLNGFDDGAEVTLDALRAAGILKGEQHDGLKILGDGDLERKLKVVAQRFSKSAMEKIQKKGGECVTLRPAAPKKERPTAPKKKKASEEGGE